MTSDVRLASLLVIEAETGHFLVPVLVDLSLLLLLICMVSVRLLFGDREERRDPALMVLMSMAGRG